MSDVTIYTKVGCPYCAAAKNYFEQEGIKYSEMDVNTDQEAGKRAMELADGARRVPVIVEGEKVTVGFRGGS
jgi:glutaredoxin 3